MKLFRLRSEITSDSALDWGHAEALALASLRVDGVPIRLTGQDTVRGTFSQRHLVLHDAETGAQYRPDPAPRPGRGPARAAQLAALGVRGARVRVRLLGR